MRNSITGIIVRGDSCRKGIEAYQDLNFSFQIVAINKSNAVYLNKNPIKLPSGKTSHVEYQLQNISCIPHEYRAFFLCHTLASCLEALFLIG